MSDPSPRDNDGIRINDIPDGPLRERFRAEILGIVEKRREETQFALNTVTAYLAAVYSGGAVAVVGYAASTSDRSVWVLASIGLFIACLASYSILLWEHYRLQNRRYGHYAQLAQEFFSRDRTLDEMISQTRTHQSVWIYRLLFWLPFSFACLGLCAILVSLMVEPGRNPEGREGAPPTAQTPPSAGPAGSAPD